MTETPSTSLAERQSTDVANLDDEALIAAAKGTTDAAELVVPLLKVGQGLTREVQSGDARPGEFINGVTGETFGKALKFIVCQNNTRGRFARDNETGRGFVAGEEDLIPPAWKDLVGEQYVGTPFSEHPDAYEVYSQRVNDGEIPWGKGPPIATTTNFTGFIAREEDADDDTPNIPVRLSLMRTERPASRKINTIIQFLRAPWDAVLDLTTESVTNDKGTWHIVVPRQGRRTTPDERAEAARLARLLLGDKVIYAAGEDDAPPEPAEPETPDSALPV